MVIRERENEADLTIAAEYANEKNLIFLLKHTCGQVCVPMAKARLKELNLDLMEKNPSNKKACSFTVSVDAEEAKTGISAKDKSLVIHHLVNGGAKKIVKPGHTFPLIAKNDGVLERQGHTEASLDLVRLAKLYPAAVICELMDKDTGMPLKGKKLNNFIQDHNITLVKIKDIIKYRLRNNIKWTK